MAYVYRYIDKADGIIKYVGIVWGESRTLKDRIREHKNDSWNKDIDWSIQYITANINTRTDAEYFEAHYVSLYETDRYFNKSKAGWGTSGYLPDRENDWIDYVDDAESKNNFVSRLLCVNTSSERQKMMRGIAKKYSANDKNELDQILTRRLFKGKTEITARINGWGEIIFTDPIVKGISYSAKDTFKIGGGKEISKDHLKEYINKVIDDILLAIDNECSNNIYNTSVNNNLIENFGSSLLSPDVNDESNCTDKDILLLLNETNSELRKSYWVKLLSKNDNDYYKTWNEIIPFLYDHLFGTLSENVKKYISFLREYNIQDVIKISVPSQQIKYRITDNTFIWGHKTEVTADELAYQLNRVYIDRYEKATAGMELVDYFGGNKVA